MLTQMADATQSLADRAGISGSPRAEAQAEVKIGRERNRVAGGHAGAQKNRFRLGSMNGLRRGRGGRQA